MRHGHKTSSGKFNGHKTQIMIDEASEIITNISITSGNKPDGEALDELLETSVVKPGILIGDTAYGTLNARDTVANHKIPTVVAPLPQGSKKGSKLSKYDFKIDFEQQTCECPAKQITQKTRKYKGQITGFVFDKQNCNKCHLRDQCTGHGKGRLVTIHPDEERRRLIISQNNSEDFKKLYRLRPKVERKAAHLTKRGLRKSRYLGKTKTLLQAAFTAAGVTLRRLFALAKGEVLVFCRLQKVVNPI